MGRRQRRRLVLSISTRSIPIGSIEGTQRSAAGKATACSGRASTTPKPAATSPMRAAPPDPPGQAAQARLPSCSSPRRLAARPRGRGSEVGGREGHKYALVMEPGRDGDRVVTSRKERPVGSSSTVKGRAALRHAPGDGRSAIPRDGAPDPAHRGWTDYARGITVNVGRIEGEPASTSSPARCTAGSIACPRSPSAGDDHRFLGRAIGADVEVPRRGGMNRPPYRRTPVSPTCSPRHLGNLSPESARS